MAKKDDSTREIRHWQFKNDAKVSRAISQKAADLGLPAEDLLPDYENYIELIVVDPEGRPDSWMYTPTNMRVDGGRLLESAEERTLLGGNASAWWCSPEIAKRLGAAMVAEADAEDRAYS